MPETTHITLSEGEFNRFYIRAICRYVIDNGGEFVKIYRAKEVANPRSSSEEKIDMLVEASKVLSDLRNNSGVDLALGIPPGPNSGLSVEIVR